MTEVDREIVREYSLNCFEYESKVQVVNSIRKSCEKKWNPKTCSFYKEVYPKLSKVMEKNYQDDLRNGFINHATGKTDDEMKKIFTRCLLQKEEERFNCLSNQLTPEQIQRVARNIDIDPIQELGEQINADGSYFSPLHLESGQIVNIKLAKGWFVSILKEKENCPHGFDVVKMKIPSLYKKNLW